MRDQDDRGAGPCQPADGFQQSVRLGVGQHRGRLVENQDSRAADQDLDDFDLLLLGDRERVDAAVGIDRKAEIGRLLLRSPRGSL